MSFILNKVDVVDNISPADFKKNYLDKRKPLVIKNLTKDWPAREKWTTDYLKSIAGDLEVPLYDNSKADPSKPINSAAAQMKLGDYLDLIKREPTELRIFFFNLFKHHPELINDIKIPKDLMGGFIESMPAMFFGGSNSITFLHYDIDLPHLFHTHFGGRKHVILFENKWKRRLYCLPNATYALEDYDVLNPDFKKFPALQGVQGEEVFLEHGDTLFMPTGYWHWMKYLDGSFSLSLRAWDKSITRKAQSVLNLALKGGVDSVIKMLFKEKYAHYREKLAIKRAEKAFKAGKL
ncbi:MAG: cupin-like domain-containing protein [Bacteroidetes bacterium]|nr:cupin-like domain-containing protein [Bacteroidota bacterium]MBU1484603.1 cupin-like domain-containing protein [Bacteroidota bacterium]MBU1759416.1 cupin-like domain-containing protein [Bacteroidota bacterium]MBU2269061.1 cupin-like domain-containing protein [Bacteroidota bacterium]MBU2375997.1 cupin-like domain-containing protein [Bacteroidota bacterium]